MGEYFYYPAMTPLRCPECVQCWKSEGPEFGSEFDFSGVAKLDRPIRCPRCNTLKPPSVWFTDCVRVDRDEDHLTARVVDIVSGRILLEIDKVTNLKHLGNKIRWSFRNMPLRGMWYDANKPRVEEGRKT